MSSGEANWILEADIVSYFDRIDRAALTETLRDRVPDGSLMRLVGKCLHVGVLDGEEFSAPDVGTPQGSILSPLLGNVYLHHMLDLWFEREIKPRLVGRAVLVRYALRALAGVLVVYLVTPKGAGVALSGRVSRHISARSRV